MYDTVLNLEENKRLCLNFDLQNSVSMNMSLIFQVKTLQHNEVYGSKLNTEDIQEHKLYIYTFKHYLRGTGAV